MGRATEEADLYEDDPTGSESDVDEADGGKVWAETHGPAGDLNGARRATGDQSGGGVTPVAGQCATADAVQMPANLGAPVS